MSDAKRHVTHGRGWIVVALVAIISVGMILDGPDNPDHEPPPGEGTWDPNDPPRYEPLPPLPDES